MTKMLFTLDMNCIIDVENDQENSPFMRELVVLHGKNGINVAISAIGASERLIGGGYANSITPFQEKLTAVGTDSLEFLYPPAHFDICFFDNCVLADETDILLESHIHEILFPNIQFHWLDFAKAHELPVDHPTNAWRNPRCDVLALWCHIKYGGDVFVTTDINFHKKTKIKRLQKLGAGIIAYPKDALALAKAN